MQRAAVVYMHFNFDSFIVYIAAEPSAAALV